MHVSIERLLGVLHKTSPAKVDALALEKRRVESGLLSVGLKIHCLKDDGGFARLIEELGGKEQVVEQNYYRGSADQFCFVLPPVGNANSAISLLECIELYTGVRLFNNSHQIQLQVCSPGRLNRRAAGLLTIGVHLGSDFLRGYSLEQLTTTFSAGRNKLSRGRRLTIYDAGELDRGYEWWGQPSSRWHWKKGVIRSNLPKIGRTDVMLRTSKADIRIVNLIATLLVHRQCQGFWAGLGEIFEQKMIVLLHDHLLIGHLTAPWVHEGEATVEDDETYMYALREIMAYAIAEALRIQQRGEKGGILYEIQDILARLRANMRDQARFVIRGEDENES